MMEHRPALSSARYDSLDFCRGIACLMVVVYHATSFGVENNPGSSKSFGALLLAIVNTWHHGVSLFFVISGFCIAAAVEASMKRRVSLVDFFRRRIRRIFPPFWILFLITALGVAAGHALGYGRFFWEIPIDRVGEFKPPADLSGTQWIGNLTLTEIWAAGHIFSRAPRYLEGLGHAWTLAYEEQFYAVCGLLLFLSGRRMKRFFAGALGVTLLTLVTMSSPVLRARVGGLFLQGTWLMFACGIAVFFDRRFASRFQRWVIRSVLAAFLVLGLLQPGGNWLLIVPTAFALGLIVLHRWDAAFTRAHRPGFVWWCGTRCYSLYLVHWPISRPLIRVLYEQGVQSIWGTILITAPIAIAASLVAAWAFHALVERRFLNRHDAIVQPHDPATLDPLRVATTA
jgi:peptidoglycan/LPS O-acetylase OafA/YrhL